jgi:hypothetical protein
VQATVRARVTGKPVFSDSRCICIATSGFCATKPHQVRPFALRGSHHHPQTGGIHNRLTVGCGVGESGANTGSDAHLVPEDQDRFELVTSVVTKDVVDRFELVQVDEDQGQEAARVTSDVIF